MLKQLFLLLYEPIILTPFKKGADFENDQYYMATFTYGIIDRINVFAKVGMVDGGNWYDYEAGSNWKGDLESNLVWAVGAKGKLYEFQNGLGFGLAAQYLRYDNRKVKNWSNQETGESASQLGWATDDKLNFWPNEENTDYPGIPGMTDRRLWKMKATALTPGCHYDVRFRYRDIKTEDWQENWGYFYAPPKIGVEDYPTLQFYAYGDCKVTTNNASENDAKGVAKGIFEHAAILQTYEDDFSKYRKRIYPERLRKVFRRIPALIGHKLKYVQLDPEERSRELGESLDLLEMARVIYRVRHSAGNGVPLGQRPKNAISNLSSWTQVWFQLHWVSVCQDWKW